MAELDPHNSGVLIVSLDGHDRGTGNVVQPDDLARGIQGDGVLFEASIAAVNLVVWGLVSVTSDGEVYPWWIWLSVPGAALLVLYVAGIGRPKR